MKPNKIRVVYNCSARYCGSSLNDILIQGLELTNSLVGVLTRFRQDDIALMADIEGMFHRVQVPVEDCDMLRFLWWPDGDFDQGLVEYPMTVHLFGAASSPSCTNFALHRTADDNAYNFSELAVETIKKNFYVDDCLKSVPSGEEGAGLARELIGVCAAGGFRLTKWMLSSRTCCSRSQVLSLLVQSEIWISTWLVYQLKEVSSGAWRLTPSDLESLPRTSLVPGEESSHWCLLFMTPWALQHHLSCPLR